MSDYRERGDAADTGPDRESQDSANTMAMALGIAVGSTPGVAMDNLVLGPGAGIAIGAGVGAALASRK